MIDLATTSIDAAGAGPGVVEKDDVASCVKRLVAMRDEVAACYVEREAEAELLALCVAARTHLTLVGPPGNAKSQIVRDFCGEIEGASYFETLLAADSPAQKVLGPYSIPALDEGRFEFATKGMLPEAHLALLDEGYRANSTLLDNLLAIANERVLHNGPQVVSVPLWTLVIACNQVPDPQDERTDAFRDRIAVTRIVSPVASDAGRRAIIAGQVARRLADAPREDGETVSRRDVETVQAHVLKVALPERFVDDALLLWRAGEEAGLAVSARRFGELVKLCQARALLSGRTSCTSDDLTLAQHILWVDPDDAPSAYEVTLAFASESVRRAAELSKAYAEIAPEAKSVLERVEAIPAEDTPAPEVIEQAISSARRLGALVSKAEEARRDAEKEGHDAAELSRVVDDAQGLAARIRRAAFGAE
jgi:MoxR-like ATPase